jgi:hypothetical protein
VWLVCAAVCMHQGLAYLGIECLEADTTLTPGFWCITGGECRLQSVMECRVIGSHLALHGRAQASGSSISPVNHNMTSKPWYWPIYCPLLQLTLSCGVVSPW